MFGLELAYIYSLKYNLPILDTVRYNCFNRTIMIIRGKPVLNIFDNISKVLEVITIDNSLLLDDIISYYSKTDADLSMLLSEILNYIKFSKEQYEYMFETYQNILPKNISFCRTFLRLHSKYNFDLSTLKIFKKYSLKIMNTNTDRVLLMEYLKALKHILTDKQETNLIQHYTSIYDGSDASKNLFEDLLREDFIRENTKKFIKSRLVIDKLQGD